MAALAVLRTGITQLQRAGHHDLAAKVVVIANELAAREAWEAHRSAPPVVKTPPAVSAEPTPDSQSTLESLGKDVAVFLDDWLVRFARVVEEMDAAAQVNSSAAGEMARAAGNMREAAGTMYMAKPQ